MTQLPDAEVGSVPQWTLGDRLRKAREHAGLQQVELGDDLGIVRNTVGNYEGDHTRPQRPTIVLWALRCGVPLEWLLTGECARRDSNPQPLDPNADACAVIPITAARRLAPPRTDLRRSRSIAI